jgi:hypothetical protein
MPVLVDASFLKQSQLFSLHHLPLRLTYAHPKIIKLTPSLPQLLLNVGTQRGRLALSLGKQSGRPFLGPLPNGRRLLLSLASNPGRLPIVRSWNGTINPLKLASLQVKGSRLPPSG